MKRVGILGCKQKLNAFETEHGASADPFEEDYRLQLAFRDRGIQADRIAWDAENIDWKSYDAGIIHTTWDYYVRCEAFLSKIDELGSLFPIWNPPSLIRWNADKRYLLELRDKGIPIIPTELICDVTKQDVVATATSLGWNQFVVKPVVGGGALETYRFPNDGKSFPQLAQAHCKTFLLQPFIPAIQTEGEWSFVFFWGTFQYAARKTPKAQDYRVQSIYGASLQMTAPDPKDLAQAREVLEALETPPLYARVDMVRDAGGKLMVMELELIEPYLYFKETGTGASALVGALLDSGKF